MKGQVRIPKANRGSRNMMVQPGLTTNTLEVSRYKGQFAKDPDADTIEIDSPEEALALAECLLKWVKEVG